MRPDVQVQERTYATPALRVRRASEVRVSDVRQNVQAALHSENPLVEHSLH